MNKWVARTLNTVEVYLFLQSINFHEFQGSTFHDSAEPIQIKLLT